MYKRLPVMSKQSTPGQSERTLEASTKLSLLAEYTNYTIPDLRTDYIYEFNISAKYSGGWGKRYRLVVHMQPRGK